MGGHSALKKSSSLNSSLSLLIRQVLSCQTDNHEINKFSVQKLNVACGLAKTCQIDDFMKFVSCSFR